MKAGKYLFVPLLMLGLTAQAAANELRNPDGFNTPKDHVIKDSQIEEYSQLSVGMAFVCGPEGKFCNEKDGPFDADGRD